MSIFGTTLGIVDMQTGYVPDEGCSFYTEKRAELVSNIQQLADSVIKENGRIVVINTKNHGVIIPELEYLTRYSKNVIFLTKYYNSLLHFDGVPTFHQIQNTAAIRKAVQGDIFHIVGVNASWCVLETAKAAKNTQENGPKHYGAEVKVPFNATMNIPYPESLLFDTQLNIINKSQSVRADYTNYIGNDTLIGESLFK